MGHPERAFGAQTRLGKLELRESLSGSFFGARHRARSANTARSGTHALGTARQMEAPSGVAELHAVRVIEVEASGVIDRLALSASAVRGAVHPALFTPLQIVRAQGRVAIATSDLPGMTVPQLVALAATRDRGLPQDIVLRIALDLLSGLHALEAAAHTSECCECLYGGLTPDSIHVGRDGQTRVLDPGVMAAAARQGYFALDPRMLAYTAPELHTESARYHARIDTFAIGAVLWELLSCRTLFLASSADETIEAVCNAPIGRVRRERFVRGEPITAAVANVVARALERDPSRRFQSYRDLSLALRDAAPAAEAEQVAGFIAAMDAQPTEQAFDAERLTSRLLAPRRDPTTVQVPAASQEPTAVEVEPIEVEPSLAALLEPVELIEPMEPTEPIVPIEVAPAVMQELDSLEISPPLPEDVVTQPVKLEHASVHATPPIAIGMLLEPEPLIVKSVRVVKHAPARRRNMVVWVLGISLLFTAAFVAFVLSTAPTRDGSPVQPMQRAQSEPPAEPEVARAVTANPKSASPAPAAPALAPAEARTPAEPSRASSARAERRSTRKTPRRATTESAPAAHPAGRGEAPKQPFIPDDI